MVEKKFVILIIEDEESLSNILASQLTNSDQTVLTSKGGFNALTLIKTAKVDLVITDVRMSEGNGLFLLDKIQNLETKKPKVIVMSGYTDLTEEEILNQGAMAFIHKPFAFEQIDQLVETAKANSSI